MKKVFLTLILATVFLINFSFATDKYQIDPVHSTIGFSVKHMVISNVKGNFTDFSGVIYLDDKDIKNSRVEVTIKASSINTRNERRDAHLKSPDFFDAEKYPDITFKSKKIEKNDNGYVIVGDLTIKGVTKEVSFPFTYFGPINDPWGNQRNGVQASLTINRQDFGVSWNNTLDNGGLVVGNEVNIEINLEVVKVKETSNKIQ